MTFTLRLGVREHPQPRYQTAHPACRWEYECGWCGDKFMTAGELVAHVTKERDSAAEAE